MSEQRELLSTGAANVVIEIQIEAPRKTTWKAMIEDIRDWWRADFLVCENSQGMRMEARLGGLLYEEVGVGAGFAWGQIISFQPPRHLAYVAHVIPPWGGPAQSVVQLELEETADGKATRLTLTDSIVGHLGEDLPDCLAAGWRQLYGDDGLKSFVEARVGAE